MMMKTKKMKNRFGVPKDLEEIYERWSDGPSADEYYKAAQRFFETKERTAKPDEYYSKRQVREQVIGG
jgi:hypothetical protein